MREQLKTFLQQIHPVADKIDLVWNLMIHYSYE